MKIKLPNGVVIDDASEELVRSILGASFTPVVTVAEAKKESGTTKEVLPDICKTITGPHKKRLTNLFLVLREINIAGNEIKKTALRKRLTRFERFAEMRSFKYSLWNFCDVLAKLGFIVKPNRLTVRIDSSII